MHLIKFAIDSVKSTLMGTDVASIIIRLLNSSLETIIVFFTAFHRIKMRNISITWMNDKTL